MESDPIGIQEGTNHLFVYVGNGPVNFVDPFGLRSRKGWIPPDLNPPRTPDTPDYPDDDPFPFTPPQRDKSSSCAVCRPVFHSSVYWSCVAATVLKSLDYYAIGIGITLYAPIVGAIPTIGLANYQGWVCHQKALYCD